MTSSYEARVSSSFHDYYTYGGKNYTCYDISGTSLIKLFLVELLTQPICTYLDILT